MSSIETDITPLLENNAATFDEPWHAQVLAIADAMVKVGNFSAAQWSDALGAKRLAAEQSEQADSTEAYYKCALAALETLLSKSVDLKSNDVDSRSDAWARAYRATPHGQPVKLSAGVEPK